MSLVVVWRGCARELDKRLHMWTHVREGVELVLVRACTTPERLRLERANPGLRIVTAASDQDLASLREHGVAAARGDIIMVLDDVTASLPSWRDRLPFADDSENGTVDWSSFAATLDTSMPPSTVARAVRMSGEAGRVARDPD